MKMKKIDLTGQRFGRLTVLELDHKTTKTYWKCKCDCGNIVVVRSTCLLSGNTKSCKCFAKEQAALKHTVHGFAKTKLYNTWRGILKRTGCKKGAKKRDKINYIDRGIDICDKWHDFENFRNWSLNNGYKENLEIDRIDNNKGYSPENCRWVTHNKNMRNTRKTIKLPDGTPFLDFLDGLGIIDKNQRCKYRNMWRLKHKIHPELKQIMKETMD